MDEDEQNQWMNQIEKDFIEKALSQNPDMALVLKKAILLFDSRVADSRHCTTVSGKALCELFLALKLDVLAKNVKQESLKFPERVITQEEITKAKAFAEKFHDEYYSQN